MRQRQRDQIRRGMQRLRVNRFDAVREVACEQCAMGYGAVAVAQGRPITVEDVRSSTGERTMERLVPLRLSYESTLDDDDIRGFLPKEILRGHRREGFASREAQKELRGVCGMTR